jgi:hypothetical protein
MNISTTKLNYEGVIASVKDLVFRKKKKFINDDKSKGIKCEDDDNWETSSVRNHSEVKNWLKWHEDIKKTSQEPVLTKPILDYLELLSVDGWDLADKRYVREFFSESVFKIYGKKEIDMQGSTITGLDDTFNKKEIDSDVATVGYVKRKLISKLPETNLNLLCSQGYKGKDNKGADVYRFFPAGIVFEERVKISKISLTTTKESVDNVQHVLKLITVPLGSNTTSQLPEEVLSKPGSSHYKTENLSNKFLQNSTAHFELQSFIDSKPTVVFNGEATLTLQIIV